MNILNLPDWEVLNVAEGDHDYVIEAKYTNEPEALFSYSYYNIYEEAK